MVNRVEKLNKWIKYQKEHKIKEAVFQIFSSSPTTEFLEKRFVFSGCSSLNSGSCKLSPAVAQTRLRVYNG